MPENDLEQKRFELEQTVKLAELELKKKELELKNSEKKKDWSSLIPLLIGILTIAFSAYSLIHQKQAEHELEEKKLLSSLILGAVEKDNYKEFAEQLDALNDLNLIRIDSTRLANFKRSRFVDEGQRMQAIDTLSSFYRDILSNNPSILSNDELVEDKPSRGPASIPTEEPESSFFWMIVAGGDKNLEGAKWEMQRANKAGFEKVDIWLKGNSFRTVIGQYNSHKEALEDLFIVQERINKGAYIVRNTNWCTNSEIDSTKNIIICK